MPRPAPIRRWRTGLPTGDDRYFTCATACLLRTSTHRLPPPQSAQRQPSPSFASPLPLEFPPLAILQRQDCRQPAATRGLEGHRAETESNNVELRSRFMSGAAGGSGTFLADCVRGRQPEHLAKTLFMVVAISRRAVDPGGRASTIVGRRPAGVGPDHGQRRHQHVLTPASGQEIRPAILKRRRRTHSGLETTCSSGNWTTPPPTIGLPDSS